jgi:NAD(P)H dehydrogenase (quinone)
MKSINTVLVVLASPFDQFDKRSGVISDLCHIFIERLKQRGIVVDFIDLYKDNYNPVYIPNKKDSQTLEYQIRLEKAKHIVFFHPIWWGSMPAILKGFCEKVFVHGFAFQKSSKELVGLLNGKHAYIITTSLESKIENKIFISPIFKRQWKEVILDVCGVSSHFLSFSDFRRVSDSTIISWHNRCKKLADTLDT